MMRLLMLVCALGILSVEDVARAFREDRTFGAIDPNEPARPAEGYPDVKPAMPPERLPSDVGQRGEQSNPSSQQVEKSSRPKYRDYYDQMQKKSRGYNDDESPFVSLGVGLGFRYFQASAGFTVPFNRYVAWSLGGSYLNRQRDDEEEVRSSGELSLILRIPNPTPIVPFVSAGPGVESWKRSKDEGKGQGLEVFDDRDSPTLNWACGASLRLARYVALTGALRSTTYTGHRPLSFKGDHSQREARTDDRFELGVAFIF
jgi:hypothetical protein